MSVIDLDWNFSIDFQSLEKDHFQNFQLKISQIHEKLLEAIEGEGGFKVQQILDNGSLTNNNDDDDLRLLIKKNKQLRRDIHAKLEDLKLQQNKYENLKKDRKLLVQEFKETYEAFLMAKKSYKKFLKLYFSIEKSNEEKQIIFVQFFSEKKKDSENYSVRLLRDKKSRNYELLSTTPKLNSHKELETKLKETNDVITVICCIRQAFMTMKGTKN